MRDAVAAVGVNVPRTQVGSNPQHLLATVLGEYLDSEDADLPSVAVVAMLREFGVSEASARVALSRLARRGLVVARRPGRRPVYHLTAQAMARHRTRMHHFLTFGAQPRLWSGDWTVVTFSLPEARQARRHELRRLLGASGFVRHYDSVWIRPGCEPPGVSEAIGQALGDVDGARWSVLCARYHDEAGPHGPAAAYDLAGLAAGYAAFVDRYIDLRAAVRAGAVDATRALVARTSIMDDWRRFADIDPDLPPHLLPAAWPRDAARDLFLEIHTALGPPAVARLIEVATPHWPAAADWITYFSAPAVSGAAAPPRCGPGGGAAARGVTG